MFQPVTAIFLDHCKTTFRQKIWVNLQDEKCSPAKGLQPTERF